MKCCFKDRVPRDDIWAGYVDCPNEATHQATYKHDKSEKPLTRLVCEEHLNDREFVGASNYAKSALK